MHLKSYYSGFKEGIPLLSVIKDNEAMPSALPEAEEFPVPVQDLNFLQKYTDNCDSFKAGMRYLQSQGGGRSLSQWLLL